MGRKKIEIHEDAKSRIIDMLNNENTLKEILDAINKEKNESYSYSLLYNYITKELKYKWDKKKNAWEKFFDHNDTKDNQSSSSDESGAKSNNSKDNSKNDINPYDSTPLDNVLIRKHLYDIHQSIESILCIVYELKHELSQIKKHNPYKKLSESPDNFARVLCSKNEKYSVSLNAELMAKLRKFTKENYGVQSNNSKAIDIALALSVFGNYDAGRKAIKEEDN